MKDAPIKKNGKLDVEILGLAGLAKLGEGDVFEVYIKHGDQKFKSHCKIEDSTQVWVDNEFIINLSSDMELLIKVMELKGLRDITIGCVSCPAEELVSPHPQICVVPINKLGTMKLRMKIFWTSMSPKMQRRDDYDDVFVENLVYKPPGISPISPLLDGVTITVKGNLDETRNDKYYVDKRTDPMATSYTIQTRERNTISSPRIVANGDGPKSPARIETIPPPPSTAPPPVPVEHYKYSNTNIRSQSSKTHQQEVDQDIPRIIYKQRDFASIIVKNSGTQTEPKRKKGQRPELMVAKPPSQQTPPIDYSTRETFHIGPVEAVTPLKDPKIVVEPAREYQRYEKKQVLHNQRHPGYENVEQTIHNKNAKSPPVQSSYQDNDEYIRPESTIQKIPSNTELPKPATRYNKENGYISMAPGTLQSDRMTIQHQQSNLVSRKEPLRDEILSHSVGPGEDILTLLMQLKDAISDAMKRGASMDVLSVLEREVLMIRSILYPSHKRSRRNSITPSVESVLGQFSFLDKEDKISVKTDTLKVHTLNYNQSSMHSRAGTLRSNAGATEQFLSSLIAIPAVVHHLKICLDLLPFIGSSVGPFRYQEFSAVKYLKMQNNIIGRLMHLWLKLNNVNLENACPELEKGETLHNLWTACVTDNCLLCETDKCKWAFALLFSIAENIPEENVWCQEVSAKAIQRISSHMRLVSGDSRISVFQFMDYFESEAKTRSPVVFLRDIRDEVIVINHLGESDKVVVSQLPFKTTPIVKACLRLVAVSCVMGARHVRRQAESFLLNLEPKEKGQAIAMYMELLEDKNESVRGGTCICLASLEHFKAVPLIALLAQMGEPSVQVYAQIALKYYDKLRHSGSFPMMI